MQASIQTDRRKKPQIVPAGLVGGLQEVEQQDEKQKERKIKKLTLVNRQLIQTLKKQNDELTKKINKQKMKVGRSVERTSSPSHNLQKQKKQLMNAYKQIEMYKTVLKDLKAKQISTQSADKLNQLENKIRYEDNTIDKLQKELKYAKNIKEQQEKELNLYQNKDVKTSVLELQEQLKQLKQKLKQSKKHTKKREQLALKQHAYFMELQKTLRKQNDQYYPGQTESKIKKDSNNMDQHQITQREWQVVRSQLAELKKTHDDNNKRIQQLTRMRNKQIKSFQQNQLRLKEKQRKLQTVKTKLAELAKLNYEEKGNRGNQNSQFEEVMENGRKIFKTKNQGNQREVKRWIIPQGYVQEKGKILPDSIFFSDKTELRTTKKSKIFKVQIWTDSAGVPAIFQFHYQAQDGRKIAGILPYNISQLQDLQDRVLQFKEGDYLAKILGKFQDGYITSLTFVSKFGKVQTFNSHASGEDFRFQPRPNQIPTCIFGAALRDNRERIHLCYLGCEFIADW